MSSIFVYSDNSGLAGELLTLARSAGTRVNAITLNEAEATQLIENGADEVLILKGLSPIPESYAQAMAALVNKTGSAVLLIGATVRGRDIAARIAAHLKCALVSDAGAVRFTADGVETERIIYGGAIVQTEIVKGLAVITVPSGKYTASTDESHGGEITFIDVETDNQIHVLETLPIERATVDISKARRIVCAGMGLDKQEDLELINQLGSVLNAAVGCTRPIADDKEWMPADTYIGISGVTTKPELYIGIGISGQVQHMVGVRDARVIVAINNNEKAPIFRVADFSILGDLYEVVPLLTQAVKELKS